MLALGVEHFEIRLIYPCGEVGFSSRKRALGTAQGNTSGFPVWRLCARYRATRVAPRSWLAIALTARVLDFIAGTASTDIARAKDLAEQALSASPCSSVARFPKGLLF